MAYTKTTWTNGSTALSAENMNHIETGIEDAHSVLDVLIDGLYPVNSIMITTDNVNPGTRAIFAGTTWEAWGSGRVPVGYNSSDTNFNSAEKTGGASTVTLAKANLPAHTHTYAKATASTGGTALTTAQMPSHSHRVTNTSGVYEYARFAVMVPDDDSNHSCLVTPNSNGTKRVPCVESVGANSVTGYKYTGTTGSGNTHSHKVSTSNATSGSTGSATAVNNLQPYITCFMWKRTA